MQFALFELGRNPSIQEMVRRQVQSSWAAAAGDSLKALQGAPLLKATVKEILRYGAGTVFAFISISVQS